MIVEVTRIMSAWARDPVNGVNAQIASVGRNRMTGGADPKPPNVTVYDDVDSMGGDAEDMSLELDPPKVPAIVIAAGSGGSFNPNDQNYLKAGEPVIVAFAYITRDVAGKKAKLDGGYTLRALRRCLYRYKNSPEGSRQLNGIKVLKIDEMIIDLVAGGVGTSQMYGLLTATVTVLDSDL